MWNIRPTITQRQEAENILRATNDAINSLNELSQSLRRDQPKQPPAQQTDIRTLINIWDNDTPFYL